MMTEKHEEIKEEIQDLPKRNKELKALLGNLKKKYSIRLRKGEVDVNDLWFNIKNLEMKITKEGIQIVSGELNDCLTSW